MNQAQSLYGPFFRWAKRRRLVTRSPMADFQLPTSSYVSSERTPPEVEQLCLLLRTAAEVVPDIAPCSPSAPSLGCDVASSSRSDAPASTPRLGC